LETAAGEVGGDGGDQEIVPEYDEVDAEPVYSSAIDEAEEETQKAILLAALSRRRTQVEAEAQAIGGRGGGDNAADVAEEAVVRESSRGRRTKRKYADDEILLCNCGCNQMAEYSTMTVCRGCSVCFIMSVCRAQKSTCKQCRTISVRKK